MTTTKISLEKFRFEIRIKESWDSFFSLFIPKSKKWHFIQIQKWRRFRTKSGQASKWRLLVISCQKFEESCEYVEEKIHRNDVNPGDLDDWITKWSGWVIKFRCRILLTQLKAVQCTLALQDLTSFFCVLR